jgi:alcohol dehydrogenase YqhD (iron-dependent ADH family)
MQGNFSYHNPTKLYFSDESLHYLKDKLKNFGPVVLLDYGSGSVKRNGIYDQVVAILKEAGKTIVENPGVMSNPTLEKLREGIKIARENNVDWILDRLLAKSPPIILEFAPEGQNKNITN